MKRNVLKLSFVELFLAFDSSRSPHFASLHTRLARRSASLFSLVPLFARSTLNPEKLFSSSAAHFYIKSRARRQQNQFYSRKIFIKNSFAVSAKNRKYFHSIITASSEQPFLLPNREISDTKFGDKNRTKRS